jgi:ABC-type branched-subunit amino acid transport system substrate-binding protein
MRYILLLALLTLASCSGVKTQKITNDEANISENVKIVLDQSRELIRNNDLKGAVAKLSSLQDNDLAPIEKALKYNLKGVTLFNIGDVDKALLNFLVAEKYAPKDTQLSSQLQLNMASAHYKLGQMNELKDRMVRIDQRYLNESEKEKFAQLQLAYGNKFKNYPMIVISSVTLLKGAKTMDEVKSSSHFDTMKEAFVQLNEKQKVEFLEKFDDSQNLAVASLAQIEAEHRYTSGDKEGAKDVVSWLTSKFGSNKEISQYAKDFESRLESSAKISVNDIGLVLPITGEKSQFGLKALSGIETGLKVLGLNENVKIHTKDSVDSATQGAQAVYELVREKHVSFIIGGLFPESATAEYLEARKYGVLYISLSQVNLPKEEKNQNLIEVQGSIESQVETLLSDEMIAKFGKRIGVIYPDNEGGKAYVDEIWRKANQKSLAVTSIASFPKNTHDYRDSAKLFLGLQYPRERSEEFKILNDVYSLERSSIRRVQTLPPVIDFDWVFLATYPHEATQLIPTLGYYDANRIKVIGGPSWASKSMVKEQKNLGTLYFVGEDPKDINQEMINKFQELNGKPAGLIEIMAIDSMKIGAEALTTAGDVSAREDFDAKLKAAAKLKGLTTEWDLKEGVWIKKMNSLTITHGEIVKMFPQ